MKYLIFLFLVVNIFASEFDYYHGRINFGDKGGHYNGIIYKDSSEDETIYYQIGLKRVLLANIQQNETFFKIKKETDLDKHIEVGIHQISNNINRGNIYMLGYLIDDKINYSYFATFSEYEKTNVYQLKGSLNSFIGDSPFYINPKVYLIKVLNDKNYATLDMKVGYMEGKNEFSISNMIGKNRYLFQEDEYYGCNLGYTTKYSFKIDYIRQLNLNYALNFSLKKYYLENTNNISVYNLTISYKY